MVALPTDTGATGSEAIANQPSAEAEPRMLVNEERIRRDLVTIGASAGGVEGLCSLFSQLPADFPGAIAAVVHRSPLFEGDLAGVLGRTTALAVAEPVDGELLQPRRIYLAPRDMHMVVEDGRVRVNRGPKEHHTRPAVDPLFSSAAAADGPGVVGVLLSGGGDDGLRGLIAIKAAGGISIVQDPAEALHPSMPRNAIVYHRADSVLPVARIGATLTALANGGPVEVEASPAGPRPSFTLDRGA